MRHVFTTHRCKIFTGFGYHTPSDDNSRLFTILVMVVGIFVIFGGISTALMNRLDDFKKKRKLQLSDTGEVFKDLQRRFHVNLFAIFASLFVAAGILVGLEGWSFAKALYFAVQTATVRFNIVRCCAGRFLVSCAPLQQSYRHRI